MAEGRMNDESDNEHATAADHLAALRARKRTWAESSATWAKSNRRPDARRGKRSPDRRRSRENERGGEMPDLYGNECEGKPNEPRA